MILCAALPIALVLGSSIDAGLPSRCETESPVESAETTEVVVDDRSVRRKGNARERIDAVDTAGIVPAPPGHALVAHADLPRRVATGRETRFRHKSLLH